MTVLRLAIAAGTVMMVGCGGGPVSPSRIDAVLTARLETAGIIFHFTTGDGVDADWQQRFHEHITAAFGIQLPTRLQYYKYRDREQLHDVTGRDTNGFAEPSVFAVHSIAPHDGHEAVHVYSGLVGRPSNFFNEGLAVALNTDPGEPVVAPQWNGTHVYAHTQLLTRTNQRRPLSAIVTTDGFRSTSEWVAYGQAGSFVLYLIEQDGLGPMLQFFGTSSQDDSLSQIESRIQATWGITLAEAEARWLAYVDEWGR